MPAVTVGNIRVSVTFHSRLTYNKQGRMVAEKTMTTSYFNATTRRAATKEEIHAAGIKNIQKRNVKLTEENAGFLFNKTKRAAEGELDPKHYANLIGSKSYGIPTEQQKQQFKDALIKMFADANPTDEEMNEWEALVEGMTPDDCQEFFQRYQTQLRPGFRGYQSGWITIDKDPMSKYTGKDQEEVALRSRNSATVRQQLLSAIREFVRTTPMVQKHLDDYYDITPKRR